MHTQTVFRLEDASGVGAFQATPDDIMNKLDALIVEQDEDYLTNHPLPWEDGGPLEQAIHDNAIRPSEVRFGTASVEQLRSWFPPAIIPDLTSFGVDFTVWEVPPEDIFAGEHQVAFRPDRARLVERKPVAALHA